LPFGRLWYGEPNPVSNAIGYAKSFAAVLLPLKGTNIHPAPFTCCD
jgi:hypothetical protein